MEHCLRTVTEAKGGVAKRAGRMLINIVTPSFLLILLFASADRSHAQPVHFVELVNFKLVSTFAPISEIGSLTTRVRADGIQMTLSNVAAAGADKGQELIALIDKSNLS